MTIRYKTGWTATTASLLLLGCSSYAATVSETAAPDLGKRLVAEQAAVSSANPLASEAGLEVLLAGGNAVDAAVATAFAVGVVEPQMSGLGGGGSALVWMQGDGHADYLDFYASQPVQAFRTLEDPAVGATTPLRIVGVPGDVAGLLALQERYGRLTRAQVMAPAIRLAQSGFPVNQILAQMIARDSVKLQQTAAGSDLLWPGGRPLGPGERIVNPELAASLRYVSQLGHAGFYQGQLARRVVAAMNAGGHPGTAEQFARYEPRWRRPLCAMYRGRVVLSAPPPQTGMQVIHTLKLLESYDLPSLGLPTRSAQAFDVMASALRNGMPLVGMNGDPSWANVPAVGVISDEFAAERRRQRRGADTHQQLSVRLRRNGRRVYPQQFGISVRSAEPGGEGPQSLADPPDHDLAHGDPGGWSGAHGRGRAGWWPYSDRRQSGHQLRVGLRTRSARGGADATSLPQS